MEDKKIRLATVFSGIGAVEQALLKMQKKYEIVFACDNGERELKESYHEINIYADEHGLNNAEKNKYVKCLYNKTKRNNWVKKSYFENYDISEERWFEDIRFIDGKNYKDKVDLFVGGSPCQSFSIIGKRRGLEDVRGTLFYEYARLVKEIQPKVFIYENVIGMLNHDKGKTWGIIKSIFKSLGYKIYYKVLNSIDYGIPQDRKRLFVVGFKDSSIKFRFPRKQKLYKTLFDFLDKEIATRHYLGEKGFKFVTNPKYKNRARVNKSIIQTQKANQQFNWNGDFVFEDFEKIKNNEDILKRAFVGEFDSKKGVIRQLTYRECVRLMGFSDDYKIVVPNVHAYRQSGNSIVVNVLENILKQIFKVEFFDE